MLKGLIKAIDSIPIGSSIPKQETGLTVTDKQKEAIEAVAKTYPGGSFPGFSYQFGNTFSWMGWNKTAQLQGGYGNKIVYAYANVSVTKLVEVPMAVYDVINEREARKLERFNFAGERNKAGAYNLLELKALKEREDHPLLKLLENPNPYQTGIDMFEALWYNYEISGDGYLWAQRLTEGRDKGQPVYLHCLPSNLVMPVRQYADINAPIQYYQFTTWWGQVYQIPTEDILHLAKWSPFDPILGGYSPLVPGAKMVAVNEANQTAQGRAMELGSTGIIVHSDIGGNSDQDSFDKLTEQQVRDIEQTLALKWQGASNNRNTHVTNGYVSVTKLGDTLAELQLCEQEKANWRDGGALFNVSPILVGDMSGGTENNVQAAYKALVINNSIPKLRKLDAAIKKWIALWYPGQAIVVKADIKKFTEISPDQKLMKEVYGDADWVDQNEKRMLIADLPEKEEYKGVTLVAGGKKTLEQIIDGNYEDPMANANALDYGRGATPRA